jgi:hypothetical protein
MATTMRAKMQVNAVTRTIYGEKLEMAPVAKSGAYPEDGSDEDNTYAKFSPSGSLTLQVANPALFGKLNPGEKYYVDFTPADV